MNINNSNADLSLGYDNNVIKSYDIYVPFINYKNEFYISLIHGLNAFGIEMNIIDKENISNMISVNNRVINDNYMKESIDYLNTKIFDFKKYPQYLQISQSQPFDKLFSEYNNNISKYLFSWQSLYGLNNYTVSLGAFPSNFIANYEGISDYLIGFYEEDERYYDVLCTIINNEQSNNNVDFSIAYKTINFLSDTGLTEMIFDVNDIESFSISSVSDCMKASEKMINLIRCSEFQRNVLDKTILTSDKLKKEMTDDKIITDLVNLSLLNKYINNTYFSSLYNNQYALYQSAVKLDSDIDNSIKNVTYDECKNLIYKSLTSISDKILNSVTLGATEIPDLLMKNIKYNNFINKSILEPSEVLGNLKDCYFIQDTVKSMCSLNIFEESENTYYNLCLILQSSLTAYESLSNNELLLSIIGEEGQTVVEEKIKNINSLLADIENCDVSFYSTNNISDEIEKIKDISVMIVPIEDETQSTEFVEITEIENTTEDITNTSIDNTIEKSKIKSVSLGQRCSGCIDNNGRLYMWGNNSSGQLGNGTTNDSSTPIKIMDNIKEINLGGFSSSAIMKDGSLYMWGGNWCYQLGNGTNENSLIPIKIMDNVKSVSLGYEHNALITEDGSLYMWGNNKHGKLGNGTTTDSSTPIKIMDNVKSVSLGYDYSGAITEDGSLYMWGGNWCYQLGNGTDEDSLTPIKIMDNIKSVTLGSGHNALITEDGSLYMWGYNNRGQVGNGASTYISPAPVESPVKIMDNVKSVSLGYDYSGAITEDGSLYMWGDNFYNQLGYSTTHSSTPKKIMDNIKSISFAYSQSSAITEDNVLYMWGQEINGTIDNVLSVNIGTDGYGCNHYGVIKTDGNLYMWGNNSSGECGNGDSETSDVTPPIKVEIVENS
ncbi:MAG: hypothetical protein U0N91_00070 [Oscillospiraceae bacterium]|nr:hypothetical protein [Intestinibacter bartlettii]